MNHNLLSIFFLLSFLFFQFFSEGVRKRKNILYKVADSDLSIYDIPALLMYYSNILYLFIIKGVTMRAIFSNLAG